MYDPLKHYVAEGLVVLHSYPKSPESDRLRGRFLKIGAIEMSIETPMGPLGTYELRVKHGNVWFNYDIDDNFFKEYTTRVASREESERIEEETRADMVMARLDANLGELTK